MLPETKNIFWKFNSFVCRRRNQSLGFQGNRHVLITHSAQESTEYSWVLQKRNTHSKNSWSHKQVTAEPTVPVGGHALNLSIARRQKLVGKSHFLGWFLRSLNRSCGSEAIADLPDITYAYHPLYKEKGRLE